MFRKLLLSMFGLLVLPVSSVLAYPFCGLYQAPDQYAAFCRYDLVANDTYRVAPGVPFVWLRDAPASTGGIRATVRPSAGASLVTVGGSAHWDGFQWWYELSTMPDRRVTGWVERVSLAQFVLNDAPPAVTPLPPTPTPVAGGITDPSIQVQANWTAPFSARVEDGVPFLWLREGPNQGAVVFTLPRKGAFRVEGPAAFDGYQWWWRVSYRNGLTSHTGWVEQGAITPVG